MLFRFNALKSALSSTQCKRFITDFWAEALATARRKMPEHFVTVPETQKPYLRQIQKKFSPTSLGDYCKSDFAKNEGIFLYPNDWRYCVGWHCAAKPLKHNIPQKSNSSNKTNKVAIIIGNGNVFSWLEALNAQDVLLIDCEPVVHNFLLRVRSLILEADLSGDFSQTKKALLEKILDIESKIYGKNCAYKFGPGLNYGAGLYIWLRDTHFLANKQLLEACQRSLKEKELLPISVNAFDVKALKELSEALKQANCVVSYMNLTNLADYDTQKTLFDAVSQLPFLDPVQIISTSRIRTYDNRHISFDFFPSKSLNELKAAIEKTHMLAIPVSHRFKV